MKRVILPEIAKDVLRFDLRLDLHLWDRQVDALPQLSPAIKPRN